MLFVFFERNILRKIINQSVNAGTHIPGTLCVFQHFAVLTLFPADHRRQKREPRPLRQLQNAVNHLVNGLLPDLAPAVRAVRNPDPRVEQAQIVINLRHSPYRRPGILRCCLLVYGNRRGKPVYGIHIRFIHLPEEHPGIGTQALHIPPLPFGIDSIESQAGFAAAGQAGYNSQPVTRNLHINILQIVFSGASDDNVFLHAEDTPTGYGLTVLLYALSLELSITSV